MRHFAVHDEDGTIATLIVGPADGPPLAATLEAGQAISEIDIADSGLDLSAFETEDAARKALMEFRVDVKREARLVRRR